MGKIKKALQEYRDMLIYQTWEKTKNTWIMEDVAKIFNLPLKTIYRIIKKVGEKIINKD